MKLDAALLRQIMDANGRRRPAMLAILRALFEGGERSRNVLEGLCRHHGDSHAAALDTMVAIKIVGQYGRTKGTVYDLTPRGRVAAAQLPEVTSPA